MVFLLTNWFLAGTSSVTTILSSNLPMLETHSSSDLVRENLNALHSARESFIKNENSDKIKKALRHNIRTYAEVNYSPGDKVFYKRRKDKKWQGPAKVLGKETNFVLIRHGAAFYRCHPCQLRLVSGSSGNSQNVSEIVTQKPAAPVRKQSDPVDSSSSDEDETPQVDSCQEQDNDKSTTRINDDAFGESNAEVDTNNHVVTDNDANDHETTGQCDRENENLVNDASGVSKS